MDKQLFVKEEGKKVSVYSVDFYDNNRAEQLTQYDDGSMYTSKKLKNIFSTKFDLVNVTSIIDQIIHYNTLIPSSDLLPIFTWFKYFFAV